MRTKIRWKPHFLQFYPFDALYRSAKTVFEFGRVKKVFFDYENHHYTRTISRFFYFSVILALLWFKISNHNIITFRNHIQFLDFAVILAWLWLVRLWFCDLRAFVIWARLWMWLRFGQNHTFFHPCFKLFRMCKRLNIFFFRDMKEHGYTCSRKKGKIGLMHHV